MITYLIVDDEPIAHDIIIGYCNLLPNMKLVKQCYDAIEALAYLGNHPVDLIFLDLNMPKLKGFDFLKTLSYTPKVIVTTAYKEYALEGYELNIIDYLLKPFSFERFLRAINKMSSINSDSGMSGKNQIEEDQYVFLYSDKKHFQVKVDTILFVEAAGNYCKVVLKEGQILVREKISELLKMLPATMFTQVHKSFIVAKNQINSIEGNRIFIRNNEIPVGKHYKANVNDFLAGR